jgi:hypothetical protein
MTSWVISTGFLDGDVDGFGIAELRTGLCVGLAFLADAFDFLVMTWTPYSLSGGDCGEIRLSRNAMNVAFSRYIGQVQGQL